MTSDEINMFLLKKTITKHREILLMFYTQGTTNSACITKKVIHL